MIVTDKTSATVRCVVVVLDAVTTRRCADDVATTVCTSKFSERRLCPRQLEMRTKLLVGSALLLWLFGLTRPRHFYSRPFGWGHI